MDGYGATGRDGKDVEKVGFLGEHLTKQAQAVGKVS